jgi:predicted Zn-dependent protease
MWITDSHWPTLSTASLAVCLVLLGGALHAQQQACSVTSVLGVLPAPLIFNAQQEQALGDVEAQWVEANYPVVQDDVLAAHLNTVAGRILAQFPPDQARVRVILIDVPEADSFSAGPDRIYITRKMVTMLNNDDELAGLLGHEMGHIVTHQNAIIVTELLHELLGVNSVTDRKDISDKLLRMLTSIDTDKKAFQKAAQVIQRREDIHQCDADRVALQTAAAAGYSPQAYLELFERSSKTNANTGSLMADSFVATASDRKRLHEIRKTLKRLPQPCREIVPAPSSEFLTWQAAVLSYPDLARR